MKNTVLNPISLLILLLITACSQNNRLSPFGWDKHSDQVDSIIMQLEMGWLNNEEDSILQKNIEKLQELSHDKPEDKLLLVRHLYWDGRMWLRKGNKEKAYEIWQKAISINDSTEHPYETHRLMWAMDPDVFPYTIASYDYLLKEAQFYENYGDYMLSADYYNVLAMFLNDLGQTNRALNFMNKADSLNSLGGFEKIILNNMLNRASIMYMSGDINSARNILNDLVNNKEFRKNEQALNYAYCNLFIECNDTSALFKAYDMVRYDDSQIETKTFCEGCLAGVFTSRNQLDSAKYYSDMAIANLEHITSLKPRIDILSFAAIVERAVGNVTAANDLLTERLFESEKLEQETRRSEIFSHDFTQELYEKESADKEQISQKRIIYILCIAAVALILISIIFLLYRRNNQHRIHTLENNLTIEKSQRKILAMKLALEQKESLIAQIEQNLESDSVKQKIESTIKTHDALYNDNNTYMQTFSELHPNFIPRIKEQYPTLTDSDIRMLSLFALGFTNKQVANTLNIRPESVKQARWRLRNKMKLSANETIESVISSIITPH